MKIQVLTKNNYYIRSALGVISVALLSFVIAVGVATANLQVFAVMAVIIAGLITLRKPWHGFVLMIFALPFIRIGHIEIGVTVIPAQLLGALTLAAFLMYKTISSEQGLRKTPCDNVLLLFFVTVVLISIVQYPLVLTKGSSPMWGGSMRNPAGRTFAQIIALALMVGIYFLTVNILTSRQRVVTTIKILLLTTFIIAVFGLYQFVGSFFGWPFVRSTYRVSGALEWSGAVGGIIRVASTCGEAKGLAFFLLPVIFLLLSLIALKQYLLKSRLISISVLVCLFIVFVLTFARSAWILFLPSLILSLGLMARYSGTLGERAKIAFKISIVFFASYVLLQSIFGLFGYSLASLVIGRWQSIPLGWEQSIDSVKFRTTLELLPQNLILGVGWGNATFYLPHFGQVEFTPNQYLNIRKRSGRFS